MQRPRPILPARGLAGGRDEDRPSNSRCAGSLPPRSTSAWHRAAVRDIDRRWRSPRKFFQWTCLRHGSSLRPSQTMLAGRPCGVLYLSPLQNSCRPDDTSPRNRERHRRQLSGHLSRERGRCRYRPASETKRCNHLLARQTSSFRRNARRLFCANVQGVSSGHKSVEACLTVGFRRIVPMCR